MGLVHQKKQERHCIQNSEKQNDIYPHQANEEEEKEEGEKEKKFLSSFFSRELSVAAFLPLPRICLDNISQGMMLSGPLCLSSHTHEHCPTLAFL